MSSYVEGSRQGKFQKALKAHAALKEVRDKRLYRNHYDTFEEFLEGEGIEEYLMEVFEPFAGQRYTSTRLPDQFSARKRRHFKGPSVGAPGCKPVYTTTRPRRSLTCTVSAITAFKAPPYTVKAMGKEEELIEVVQDVLVSSGLIESLTSNAERTEQGLVLTLNSGEKYEVMVRPANP